MLSSSAVAERPRQKQSHTSVISNVTTQIRLKCLSHVLFLQSATFPDCGHGSKARQGECPDPPGGRVGGFYCTLLQFAPFGAFKLHRLGTLKTKASTKTQPPGQPHRRRHCALF